MAAPGKLEVEVETKSNPDKLWTALLDSYKVFPEAFPDKFKSVEILEGDGKAPGSVRLVKYGEGNANFMILWSLNLYMYMELT